MNGVQSFLTVLKKAGVNYLFGVPGTTEVALMDELSMEKDLQYVLALHESIAVGIADGYARASGKPGVANVHTTVGTANSLGMLINSFMDGIPLVLTAGIKDHRALGTGVFCDSPGSITELPRQYAKWSWQVLSAGHIARDVSKALRLAQSPRQGPVFVGIPEDFWLAEQDAQPLANGALAQSFRAEKDSLEAAIKLLRESLNPILVVGNEVGRTGAVSHAVSLAERWSLPVFSEERMSWAFANFPTDHPLYVGHLNPHSPLIKEADLALCVGAHLFMPPGYRPGAVFQSTAKTVQIHPDPGEIGKDAPAVLGIVSGAKDALADLLESSSVYNLPVQISQKRYEKCREIRTAQANARQQVLSSAEAAATPKVQHLIHRLSRLADPNAAIVNEGIRSGFYVQDYFELTKERTYFGYTGGCLGWGLPAALGVKLAQPGRQVIALLGDGSFMFSPQALWTAAHYGIAIKAIICNNSAYMAVKGSIIQFKGHSAANKNFVGTDLSSPAINHTGLCQSLGVPAWRAATTAELEEMLPQLLAHQGPAVLEVVLDPADMEQRPE